jgi:Fe-S cluster assembly protein SufD
VVVDEVAHGSVAHQTNRNLLLSREAEVDTRPQLEIYAKEVEASHGATVGQLEEEQLFYLASRGVDAELATALLRAAFVEETLIHVAGPELRSWVRAKALTALGVPSSLLDLSEGLDDLG